MDIYNHKRNLENAIRRVKKSTLTKKNKEGLLDFTNFCIGGKGISIPCTLKYLHSIKKIGLWLNKDFESATRKDIEGVVSCIQNDECTEKTKQAHKVALRVFYKWLKGTEEVPDEVKWIKTTLKNRNHKIPEELLTEEEVTKMIEITDNLRDKAIVPLLYESGIRIGELLSMKMKNLNFDKYGATITVNGKTGMRRMRVVASTPYLASWKNIHPFRDNLEAPLWIGIGNVNKNEYLNYASVRKMLIVLARKAGIKKHVNPHNFRHSSATVAANFMTEAQMKEYFGWTQGSEMASIYVHLSGRDTDKAVLKRYGMLEEEEKEESKLKPKKCPRCSKINSATSKFCDSCGAVLDAKTAIELEGKREEADDDVYGVLEEVAKRDPKLLVQIMREKGWSEKLKIPL
jgi:site-specific recombinase XerD